jgi:MFS family permease
MAEQRSGLADRIQLRSWLDSAVFGPALVACAAGFGQFGAVAVLGDVAKAFGHESSGPSLADQAGLSGTELGIGLAILRLASIGGLAFTGLADRFGRKPVLLISCLLGLLVTVIAAGSPGYWWFVAIFAIGRPLLSTTAAVAQVIAAEETNAQNRARAIALVAAGYGVGSGLTAVIHSLFASMLSFRVIFALAAIPLTIVFWRGRRIHEPDRYLAQETAAPRVPILGALRRTVRRRLAVVALIAFTVAIMTGPANSFVFIYSENVLHQSGVLTALMVSAAAITGLSGLVVGERLADRFGRRITGACAVLAMGATEVLAYSGSKQALFVGYVLGVLAAGALAPAAGALGNELFSTSVRASVAGFEIAASVLGAVAGLVIFGALADVGNHFSTGAWCTALAALPAAALFVLLPETRGIEPEDLWGRA